MNEPAQPFALLFLCTANRCRSPFAAALAQRRTAGNHVIVRSAGLLPGGKPVPETGLRVAGEHGLDLSAHLSRSFSAELADDADLILTMTRSQAREVVADHPTTWPRVFTLKAFARWIQAQDVPAAGLSRGWLEEAAGDRALTELLGASSADEVDDPMGQSLRDWRRIAIELRDAVDRMVPALPSAPRVVLR